jgi:hypothetical protein
MAPTSRVPCDEAGTPPHDAPELEAQLPAHAQGRDLKRWSARGQCLLEVTIKSPDNVQRAVSLLTHPAGSSAPVNMDRIAHAYAGRQSNSDPPYFVIAADRSGTEDEIGVSLDLLFGGFGFEGGVAQASQLSRYEVRTIGPKRVYVGTTSMLRQDEHQRGRPYLYQTENTMFVVITDDDAWATEIFAALPDA